ncbi:YgiQ family radical SAM protein [Paludibacter sp. 221]|uniref:YgiQ family radical SAM protein n=1 Tax=Paludibacter sp. 221 TaxID=2302939 RepID=UPI0013D11628|nr:YgiQ family radical SAM protein [Paludibacter sp. 221]NDV47646.1 YgiQ family radical SAM protein [Paludibacter sp. 221]
MESRKYQLTDFLPTTKKELELRGWDEVDVVLFTGDAYVDHPSFANAVIGRTLEAEGLRVAIVPQPNWQDDLRDFKKMGRPRLFFAVSAGNMDSMVNHYTANKRLRSDDAYSPDGRAKMRPDYTTITYCNILKRLYPDVPLVIGGIEASLRRVTHYDYWSDKLMPSILIDSKADLLIYGMGEKPLKELVKNLREGQKLSDLDDIPQTVFLSAKTPPQSIWNDITLVPHEVCLKDKKKYASNFKFIEEESNKYNAARLIQKTGDKWVVVNPPFHPLTEQEMDASFALPYTRMPHPKYRGKTIPAYEMIKFSVNLHRGCFGGCAFCTISAHQGKFIASRSKQSIVDEVKKITQMDDFKGYLSDLGGPSANMYAMQGKDLKICEKCKKPSCIFPVVCNNLNANHAPLLEVYRAVDKIPEVKKSFIGSGVRYDMLLHESKDTGINKSNVEYTKELITKHVSGRLKVAPEHTSTHVLNLMRKPSFGCFGKFKAQFDRINAESGLNQQLIPYFISSHPGCSDEDMAELAVQTKKMNFHLEQVQDFTPTPMTLATEIYYSGYHPYTLEPVYTAKTKEQKLNQRKFFFWYKSEYRKEIIRDLQRMKRSDLQKKLFEKN